MALRVRRVTPGSGEKGGGEIVDGLKEVVEELDYNDASDAVELGTAARGIEG